MRTIVALFRGINVGGRHILPMQALRDLLAQLGLQDVRTYIQSGNVVFRTRESDLATLSARITAGVLEDFGFEPHVLLMDLEALQNAVDANPFPEGRKEPKSLHFYFLVGPPPEPNLAALEALKTNNERYALAGEVFYLHAPEGIGRSKLATAVEKLLGVPATARNWRTVSKLLEMAME